MESQAYLVEVAGAISRKNGSLLARLLALPINHGDRPAPIVQSVEQFKAVNVDGFCKRYLDEAYASMVSGTIYAAITLMEKDLENGTSFSMRLISSITLSLPLLTVLSL